MTTFKNNLQSWSRPEIEEAISRNLKKLNEEQLNDLFGILFPNSTLYFDDKQNKFFLDPKSCK